MAARSFLYGGDSVGAGGGGGGSSSNSVLQTNKRMAFSSDSAAKPLDSFFVSGASHSFVGSRSMVSFEDGGNGSGRPFFQTIDQEDNGDDEYDDYFHHPEKKRRLKADQVRFLEKSFETENKLEPERKIQLAKDLGLQPRQIAIWFQNRRARWKTKQLEKDYDLLQESYNELKTNYENLVNEQEKLKSKVLDLRNKLLLQQTEKGTSESSSSKSLSVPIQQEPNAECVNDDEDVSKNSDVPYVQDDNVAMNSKSVVTDSNSPRYVDHSDESLDVGEHNLEKMFVTPVSGYMLPKIETDDYPELDAVNSCYPGHDHDHDQLFGFWSLLS